MSRPVLAVDIDGVLNALGNGAPSPGWGDILVCRSDPGVPPRLFRLRFSPHHGSLLRAAAGDAELVWCTRWEAMANDLMAPLLSLPALPWVPMRASKAEALSAWAGTRPVCWLDDEPEAEALGAHPAPAVVIAVDGANGLEERHLAEARAWLASLSDPAGNVTYPG